MKQITFLLVTAVGFALAADIKKTIDLDFEESLQCAGCVRSGYVFCGKPKNPSYCLKNDNTTAIADF